MNITIIIVEAVALAAVFTALILIPLVKNPVWWIHDYPPDIQEVYLRDHESVPVEFFSATVLIKKGCALLFALAVLYGLARLAGAQGFKEGFIVTYGLWNVVNWYDCFFLDWVLFARLKAVRLPGTEDMDEAYHQKKYHVVRALWGMLLGLIPCLLAAALLAI